MFINPMSRLKFRAEIFLFLSEKKKQKGLEQKYGGQHALTVFTMPKPCLPKKFIDAVSEAMSL